MGRTLCKPNKQCDNCEYWSGSRNTRKGVVAFADCTMELRRTTSHGVCKEYKYYRQHKIFEDKERIRKMAKSKKDTFLKFRIANDWTCFNGIVNIDLFTIHWEKKDCFWICLFGISFIWEHLKTKERNKW